MKERDRCVRAVPSPDFPKESIACGAFTEGGPFCAKHASPATPPEDTRGGGGGGVAWLSQGGDVSRSAAYFREMGFHEPYTPLYARSAGPEAEQGREGVRVELSEQARTELEAFTEHLHGHRRTEAGVEGCRFCRERATKRLLGEVSL